MLSRNGWIGVGLGLALVAVAALPASAGTAYRYTAADGSLAFTDDLARVPEALRGSTDVVDTKPLTDYSRLSPTHVESDDERITRMQERSERLRKIANEAHLEQLAWAAAREGRQASPASANGVGGPVQPAIDINGATIRLPAAGSADGPIVVEQVRAFRKGKIISQESTVVRQGDEILMIVFPEPHLQTGYNDFVREDDILEGR
ncbi:MAG: hypothetical protein GY723_10030 [bacterium]|nr:hypothetical protein [bacterium]